MTEISDHDALSFDVYGTLIDWETGITAALRPWTERRGLDVPDETLIELFGAIETGVEQERPGALYPEILAEVHRKIASRLGVEVDEATAAEFGRSVGDWPAFPDSAAALARLAERYRLIVLSNVDRRSFARSNKRLGVTFDLVLTAEDIGSYKPDPANFAALIDAAGAAGIERSRLLHVAESLYHDHEPAATFGLDSVWIHRRHDRVGHGATHPPGTEVAPTWRFTSMQAFADAALT